MFLMRKYCPIFQVRKLRLGEVKSFAYGRLVNEWCLCGSDSGLPWQSGFKGLITVILH